MPAILELQDFIISPDAVNEIGILTLSIMKTMDKIRAQWGLKYLL